MTEHVHDDVRTSVRSGIGRITLDRPKAMNALTYPMVRRVDEALRSWQDDPDVAAVLIDGAGERGLCAGGDIKMFHASALADGHEARQFWAAEYRMNSRIDAYAKPVVALMFGAVFGGGVGISAHAGHRVVTDASKIGMPEVGIGFVPDVGGTYLLARAPGRLGLYLGLTGLPCEAGDALLCGLADDYVPASALARLRSAQDAEQLLALITEAAAEPPPAPLAAQREWIDACFDAPSAREAVERLRDSGEPEAAATADVIDSRSPEAVELTLLAIRHAAELPTVDAALDVEFALANDSLHRPDFVEGIRAQVIDKDRNPAWRPPSLADVDLDALRERFTALASAEPERQSIP